MKYLIAPILTISLLSASVSFAKETTTKIGEWRTRSGSVQFSVVDADGKKRAQMFVADEYIIRTNFFLMNKDDLQKIRSLINETILELDSDANKSSKSDTPVGSQP
jgi:hypothetical protein